MAEHSEYTKRYIDLMHPYRRHNLPPGFSFVLDRLIRGFILVQPTHADEFAAILLRELMETVQKERSLLPKLSYLDKLRQNVDLQDVSRWSVTTNYASSPDMSNMMSSELAKQDESFAALLEGFSDVTDSVPETAEGSSSAEKAIVYDLPDNVQGEKTVRCGKITAFGESQIDFGRELGVQVSDNCFLFNTTSGSADQYNRYNQKEVVTVVSNFTIANECKSCRRLSCEGVSAYTQTDRSVMSFSPSPTPLSVKNLFHSCHVVPLQQLCSSCCCDVTINGVNLGGKTESAGDDDSQRSIHHLCHRNSDGTTGSSQISVPPFYIRQDAKMNYRLSDSDGNITLTNFPLTPPSSPVCQCSISTNQEGTCYKSVVKLGVEPRYPVYNRSVPSNVSVLSERNPNFCRYCTTGKLTSLPRDLMAHLKRAIPETTQSRLSSAGSQRHPCQMFDEVFDGHSVRNYQSLTNHQPIGNAYALCSCIDKSNRRTRLVSKQTPITEFSTIHCGMDVRQDSRHSALTHRSSIGSACSSCHATKLCNSAIAMAFQSHIDESTPFLLNPQISNSRRSSIISKDQRHPPEQVTCKSCGVFAI